MSIDPLHSYLNPANRFDFFFLQFADNYNERIHLVSYDAIIV